MNKTILAVAILTMAAFAGVMIVGDDTDADTNYTITYKGELGIVTQTGSGAVTLKGVDDVSSIIEYDDEIYEFIGWMTESTNPIVYKFTSGAGPAISLSEDMTLVPAYELKDGAEVVFLKLDDVSYMIKTAEGKVDFTSTADDVKAFLAALKVKEDAGFKFDGYFTQGDNPTQATVTDGVMTIANGETYNVRIHMAYEVKYVVEGTTILTVEDSITIKLDKDALVDIPVAPSKENHVFAAWTDKDGAEVITYVEGIGYKSVASELKFTEDTALYAKFVPNNMTVTFQVGEFTSTQTVLYGEKAMKPELPAGYIAWMFEDKEFDFDTPIVKNITIVALEGEPATVYSVVFEIEGQTPVKLDSENYKKSIPDTAREGYAFQGWVVKGASQYVDPMTYEITGDITFVAVYKEVAPPEPEQPKFYQTPLGQCAIILAVFVVGLVFYGIFTGRINVPKFKISRVEKVEEPAVEQVPEEKKP